MPIIERQTLQRTSPMAHAWGTTLSVASLFCTRRRAGGGRGALNSGQGIAEVPPALVDPRPVGAVQAEGAKTGCGSEVPALTELSGKEVAEVSGNVLLTAACGDGFCLLLAEREVPPPLPLPDLLSHSFPPSSVFRCLSIDPHGGGFKVDRSVPEMLPFTGP